ncbi:hypothetical protein L208DRAFT_443706 [Tricholoma matsutake]|nr:hypothetical protein L208DRAFT_443706 [Tricholoma matsutake 945]
MSYKLRSTTRRVQGESIRSTDAGSSVRGASMHPLPSALAARSFADVVVARSPSPFLDGVRNSSDDLTAREGASASINPRVGEMPSDDDDEGRSAFASPLFGVEEEDRELWVTVKPRRSRSLESLKNSNIRVRFLSKCAKAPDNPRMSVS